jgi:branched-chain amino acid transport system ATP-binding protein
MPSDEPLLEITGLSSHYGPVCAIHSGRFEPPTPANWSRWSAATAPAKPPCSTPCPVSTPPAVAASASPVRTSPAGRRIASSPPASAKRPKAARCSPRSASRIICDWAPIRQRRDQPWVHQELERVYALFPILHDRRHQLAGALSGGQQQMLAIGRALLGRPRLLLLDEPSMGLAPLLVEEIFRVIQRLNAQGVTILLVEQNARAALALAQRGAILETGRIVKIAPAAELLADDAVRRAYLGY